MVNFNARQAFGFGEAGFVTRLIGDEQLINQWSRKNGFPRAYYNILFGWTVPSNESLDDLPSEILTQTITWNMVKSSKTENRMTDWYNLQNIIEQLNNVQSNSNYQGTIGETLHKQVIIVENKVHGKNHQYILQDQQQNYYLWETKSQDIATGTFINLSMRIKEHIINKGTKYTIVHYCRKLKGE